LAGELLREAEKLVAAKIHPMTIIAGLFPYLLNKDPDALTIGILFCIHVGKFLVTTSLILSVRKLTLISY
jgi:hypothetical protein